MASIKISDLSSVTTLASSDVLPIVNGNDTKKVSISQLSDKIISDIGVTGFTPVIVQTLPTQDIDTHTIYLVPKTGETGDIYDEYIYINNAWEHIGSTSIDLSDYYTKSEVDDIVDAIPTGGTDSKYIYEGKTSEYTSSNRLSLNDLSLGLHVFFVDSASLLVKATINGTDYNQSITTPYNNMLSFDNLVYILKEQEIPDTVTSDITFGKTYFSDFTQSGYIEKIGNDISIRTYGIVMTQNIFITSNYRSCTLNTAQTISGIKTFTALPETSIAPTTNNQLTNKQYVDDAIATAITTTLGGSA